jgi:hypothetical protein
MTRMLASYELQDDDIDGQRLRVGLRTNRRFNLDAELTRYDEDLGTSIDHLWHYKTLLTYSFAVSKRAHFSAGLGVRGMRFKKGDNSIGFVSRYEIELFPVEPLHIWALGELGRNSASVASEFEIGVGALLNRFEAFIGYRHFRIVGISFAGPEAGVAVWF